MAKRRAKKADLRTWLIRAGIAVAVSLPVGFGLGAIGVRVLQPSVALAVQAAEERERPARPPKDETAEPAAEPEKRGVVVPELVGLDEGDARQAIQRAGFAIGSVTFRSGPEPLGTVVASFPVQGEAVELPATINLILSDGKGSADSATGPSLSDSTFRF
ncbi:MAG: PASTA domain-containing protein [Gemmatimonas sp.]